MFDFSRLADLAGSLFGQPVANAATELTQRIGEVASGDLGQLGQLAEAVPGQLGELGQQVADLGIGALEQKLGDIGLDIDQIDWLRPPE